MKDLLIKGGLVVTETTEDVCDILCCGETIKKIGVNISSSGAEIIDAAGKIVIPGGVDVHTHLCLDTGSATVSDDFYTGTLAAAWGGTTTIVDHPGFGPALCSLDHQIKKYHSLAQDRAVIDYGFHGVIQHVDDDALLMMEPWPMRELPVSNCIQHTHINFPTQTSSGFLNARKIWGFLSPYTPRMTVS